MRLRYLLAVAGVLALAVGCAPGAGDIFTGGGGGGGSFTAALGSAQAAASARRRERERQLALAEAVAQANLAAAEANLAAAEGRRLEWEPTCERWDWQFLSTATPAEVDSCLAAGARVNERDGYGNTPLHDAAWFNDNPAVIWTLVRAGAWVNGRDAEHNATPLHYAAFGNNNPAVVTALLDAGADAGARDAYGRTPWDLAQDNEALKGTDALLRLNEVRFR